MEFLKFVDEISEWIILLFNFLDIEKFDEGEVNVDLKIYEVF